MIVIKSTMFTNVWHGVCLLLLITTANVSQAEPVFSLDVDNGVNSTLFNFSLDYFKRFYNCLCPTSNSDRCWALGNPQVTEVKSCYREGNNISRPTEFAFDCRQHDKDIVCDRQQASDSLDLTCISMEQIPKAGSIHCPPGAGPLIIFWDSTQRVTVNIYHPNIGIGNHTSTNLFYLVHYFNTKSTSTSSITATTSENPPPSNEINDDGNDVETTTIIGGSVGVVVMVAIIIVVVILWRRRKKSQSSLNTKTMEDETDIYPYGDSTLNRIEPMKSNKDNSTVNGKRAGSDRASASASGLNEETKPSIETLYATVDLSAKTKHRPTADGICTKPHEVANPDIATQYMSVDLSVKNKLQPTTARSHSSGYEEVHLDTAIQNTSVDSSAKNKPKPAAAGTHSIGYEEVHSVTAIQITSLDSLAKRKPQPADEGVYSKTHDEASADVARQCTSGDTSAKNKRKPATDDVSSDGYENAFPDTAIQFSLVDLPAKNQSQPAVGDVYAKLHDPIRNFTHVYNQLPATDNVGK